MVFISFIGGLEFGPLINACDNPMYHGLIPHPSPLVPKYGDFKLLKASCPIPY